MRGREFDLLDFRQSWGEDWLYFRDDTGRLTSVRARWTDAEEADPFQQIAAGRSAFRAADLLRLAGLIEELKS